MPPEFTLSRLNSACERLTLYLLFAKGGRRFETFLEPAKRVAKHLTIRLAQEKEQDLKERGPCWFLQGEEKRLRQQWLEFGVNKAEPRAVRDHDGMLAFAGLAAPNQALQLPGSRDTISRDIELLQRPRQANLVVRRTRGGLARGQLQ